MSIKRLFIFTMLLSLGLTSLTACGTASTSERAGAALADIACLGLTDTEAISDTAVTDEIAKNNGFADGYELDVFLSQAQASEEINQVSADFRNALENTCPDKLEAAGVSAADIAQSIIFDL